MNKILLLIFLPLFFVSCDSEVDMDTKIYGTWVPKDGKTGLIYQFNSDNTGAVYYARSITEEGVYICDECLTEKITNLTLQKMNGLHELNMHLSKGGAFNNFYDILTDNELRFMSGGQHSVKQNNAVIVERKLSCE